MSVSAEEVLCGDSDGDGLLETEDIQQCLDALSGPGPHRVQLIPDAVFEPHFAAPPFYNPLGFVELESETTLDCQGSAIRGIDAAAKRAPASWGPLWVVTNSDHLGDAQSDIWVRNCEIDGGMPPSYNANEDFFDNDIYMGFALYGVARGGITDSHVHDTHHSCVYIRNSQDIEVHDNLLEDCGGANNAGTFRQPAVYLFQAGATVQERISVRRNRALHSGAALYNTRVSQGNPEYQTAWMRDVIFEDNLGDQSGNARPCVTLRGAREVVVRRTTCENTAGIFTSSHNSAYCSDNPPAVANGFGESNCLEDVLIEDNLLINTLGEAANGALQIYDYHDRVTLRANRVIRTEALANAPIPCLRWQMPLRGFQVEGLCAMQCADAGLEQHPLSEDQVGAPLEERIVLRDVLVQGTGADGVVFHKQLEGLTVDRLAVRNSAGAAFAPLVPLVDPVLTELDFSEGPLPAWAAELCPPQVPSFPSLPAWTRVLPLALGGWLALTLHRSRRKSQKP